MHKTQDSPNGFSSPRQVSTGYRHCLEQASASPSETFPGDGSAAVLLHMKIIRLRYGPSTSILLTMLHVLPQSNAGGAINGMLQG